MSRAMIDDYVARMRKEIRHFYKLEPWAFRECIAEFEAWARTSQSKRGRPEIPRLAYAAILAEWENFKEDCVGRPSLDAFVARHAARGWKWADRARRGSWRGKDAIKKAITKAQRMARNDHAFRHNVVEWRQAQRELKTD